MKKRFARLGIVALLITLGLLSVVQPDASLAQDGQSSSKISPLLRLQVEAKVSALEGVPLGEGSVAMAPAMQAMGEGGAPVDKQMIFIHFDQQPTQSQLQELEEIGITPYPDSWIPPVKHHPTGFIIADMPLDKLELLAEKDYVIGLETAEQVFEPQNDLATQKINADDVWSSLGYDGTGVKIAVLDSGFQVGSGTGHAAKHGDFPSMTAGTDYKDYSDPANLDDDVANVVDGHGTHVAGSALGRGTQSSGVYKGSAPDATPIFLKIGNDTTGNASSAAMVAALHAAVDDYNADVITMSYGGWSTYHDGTGETCQAVDYAVEQGAVVFISAGNEANDDEHYSGTVSATSWSDWIQVTSASSGYHLYYNMVWYDGTGTSNNLELHYYNSSQIELTPSTSLGQSESDSRGTESECVYYGSGGYITETPAGTYYLRVYNDSGSAQLFHLYNKKSGITFNSPDSNYTITSPADADSAIAVGAYNTRQIWYDYANDSWWYSNDPVGQISTFSSRGPRVDAGAPAKPNIVAPGSAIISCRDDDVYPWGSPTYKYISNNGPNDNSAVKNPGTTGVDKNNYYLMRGTSMACPMAAGVGALILENNSTWTPAQVRHALESNATDKGDMGRDDVYGWGLIDAYDAANSSLPTAASYKDTNSDQVPDTAWETFSDYETEHIVYICNTGLLPSQNYRMAYYDGGNDKRATEDASSDASGNLTTHHTFIEGTDVADTWHVIVCDPAHTPPDIYSSTWAYTLSEDTFQVRESAIPEFPTVIAAIVSLSLCLGIYLWLRRKAAPVPA